jgi:glutathione peroxidase
LCDPELQVTSFYDFSAPLLDGKPQAMADYRNKVVLVVNVASQCGNTPQYAGLESLWRAHKDQGLVVLGFPCNQFGEQEPGSAEEIAQFCSVNYDVTFPIFSKIEVNGPHAAPLYKWLKAQARTPGGGEEVRWNFEKFLIGRDGQVAERIGDKVLPEAFEGEVEKLL